MNRGIGLVAYGDSDSESSDEDKPMTTPTPVVQHSTAPRGDLQAAQETQASSDKDTGKEQTHVESQPWYPGPGSGHASGETRHNQQLLFPFAPLERPTPQDTISPRPMISNARASGNGPLNRVASNNLMRQVRALSSTESMQGEAPSASSAIEDLETSDSHSFIRSQTGTPLPADHSAAADVFNTPTSGMSPRVMQTERATIADVLHGNENEDEDVEMKGSARAIHGLQGRRAELMRLLLRPKHIPGVENFGFPPSPEGEVNSDVQSKMEQFQHVKVTRGIHFNQSLMRNKNFRNPHIYASLVEFVALNEIGSNFEKTNEFFDFEGYGPESYAAGIAEAQKQAYDKISQQQVAGARSQLHFVPAASGSVVGGGIAFPLTGLPAVRPLPLPSNASAMTSSAVASAAAAAAALAAGMQQRARKSKWDASGEDPAAGKRTRL